MTNQEFGQWLENSLRIRGKNQADLWKKLKISRNAVSLWCNGENQPSGKNLTKIKEYLDNVKIVPEMASNSPQQQPLTGQGLPQSQSAAQTIADLQKTVHGLQMVINTQKDEIDWHRREVVSVLSKCSEAHAAQGAAKNNQVPALQKQSKPEEAHKV